MYTIRKRAITLEDFLRLKGFAPFKKMRFNGKTVGLGTLFAAQGRTLAKLLKEGGYTEADCDSAIDSFDLGSALAQLQLADKRGTKLVDLKYIVVGSKLRELFFKTYPSLLLRVEREQSFAIKHGYVRSWSGPVRHLHELRYLSKNPKGNLWGIDKKLHSKLFASLKNIASNSTIQTAEVQHAAPDVTCVHANLKKWGFRSRIFNYVHDDLELYVYKPEKDVVYALLNKVANINREPYYDIPMEIDVNEADLSKGEIFKNGREINISGYDLDKELAKWNEARGLHPDESLEFINNIPL